VRTVRSSSPPGAVVGAERDLLALGQPAEVGLPLRLRLEALARAGGVDRGAQGLRWRPSTLIALTPILMISGSSSSTFRLVGSSSA